MTFLQLVNRLRQEAGISGPALSSLSSLSGESQRCKDWISQAWTDIQLEHEEWDWLRGSVSFNTTAAQQAYTPSDAAPTGAALSDFGSWLGESFRIYLTATGTADEQFLTFRDYDDFRDLYVFSSQRTNYMRPLSIAVRPNDKALLLGPAPDAIYTVVGEYYKSPTVLSSDADEPVMPTRFHMMIVYRALMSYGLYESAAEVITRARADYNEMLKRLEFSQLQPVTLGGPLA